MAALPICCITGRIAGDPFACGDCDPCIMGAHTVPDVVKALIKERDEWAEKYAAAMNELDDIKAALGEEESDYVSGSCPPDPAPGEPLF